MSEEPNDLLEAQIEEARRSIASDGYPMSVGELTNLYRDGELIIRPAFQRFFRWTQTQRSRLIESILLGIPLPSIFVSQSETGKWELVDGLQRVSTILQLQGELKDKQGFKLPPTELTATKYLPALEGRFWSHENEAKSLTEAQRLDIKRSKIDIKIIKRESSKATKFDLFQRLNSYGSTLTPQETRSALLVAVSEPFFEWLERLASDENFVASVALNDRALEEQFDLDLVLRFLVLHDRPAESLSLTSLRDFNQVLDDEAIKLASEYPTGAEKLEETFRETFNFVAKHGGPDIFRKWDPAKKEFKGPFLQTAFEIFAAGLGYHIASGSPFHGDLMGVVTKFWERPEMRGGYATGRSTERRLSEFIPLGRSLLDSV